MPFRNIAWLEACKEGPIPFVISTIFHTSLILILALGYSVEQKPTQSSILVTFPSEQAESAELDSIEWPHSKLVEFDVPTSSDMTATEPTALSEAPVSMQLKSIVSQLTNQETTRVGADSLRERPGRKAKVTPVSKVTKTLSFGKKTDFGSKQMVQGKGSTLEVAIADLDPLGTRVLSQAGNLSLTGGAMMVSTACPAPTLENIPLQFRYDATKEDGRRLVVVAGKQTARLSIYDWELLPLAKFVDSDHNGAVSIQLFGNREVVSLDAAFEQTLLGLRFIQADLMPRGIVMSQAFLPQDENGIIVGPGEQERLASDEDVKSAVKALKPLMEKTRNGASFSVLTDASVRFVFEIADTELVITGSPYFFFWEPGNNGQRVLPKKALNEALKKAWPQIKQANPLVIESMERSFSTVAFFRFQKQRSPSNWNSFIQQVSKANLSPVPTPAMLTN